MRGLAGEIAIAFIVTFAAFTVSLVVALTPFSDTVTFVLPAATPVATPNALMPATAAFDEVHVADEVITALLPSLYFPVAVKCWVAFIAMLAFRGAIAIDVSIGFESEPGDGFGTGNGLVEPVELQPVAAIRKTEVRKQNDWMYFLNDARAPILGSH